MAMKKQDRFWNVYFQNLHNKSGPLWVLLCLLSNCTTCKKQNIHKQRFSDVCDNGFFHNTAIKRGTVHCQMFILCTEFQQKWCCNVIYSLAFKKGGNYDINNYLNQITNIKLCSDSKTVWFLRRQNSLCIVLFQMFIINIPETSNI
jgi:hypothetical protein